MARSGMRRAPSRRAIAALLRVGALEALAYRSELLVWVLTSTMPLIMLALFTAVASDAPLGRFAQRDFVAYFLVTFVVRQATSSWVSWTINAEVRDGTLATRLVRPIHPLFGYATEGLAATPLRAAVSVPVALLLLALGGRDKLATDGVLWALFAVSVFGAWVLSFCVSASIGALAFSIESSTKVADVWLALFFVFSGYLIPIELFPPTVRHALAYLPFRYQIGLPVELATGAHGRVEALGLVARQWAFVTAAIGVVAWSWRRGLARFSAYGG